MVGYNLRPRQSNGVVCKEQQDESVEETIPKTPVKSSTQDSSNASMGELNRRVQAIVAKAGWWDLYGVDCCIIIGTIFTLVPTAVLLLRSEEWGPFLGGK